MSHVAAQSQTTRESQVRAGKVFAVRPRTQNDRAIRDVRPGKHQGGRPCGWQNTRIARASSPAGNGSRTSISVARGPSVPRRSKSWTSGASNRESGASLHTNGTGVRFARTSLRRGSGWLTSARRGAGWSTAGCGSRRRRLPGDGYRPLFRLGGLLRDEPGAGDRF
jgi:hypothetical protein